MGDLAKTTIKTYFIILISIHIDQFKRVQKKLALGPGCKLIFTFKTQ